MSLTRTVPAAVPLLTHSSAPFVPSDALKKTLPLLAVSDRYPCSAIERDLTRAVHPGVPSVFHSPAVFPGPPDVKNNTDPLLTGVKSNVGPPSIPPVTKTVPAAVPSLL